MPQPDGSDTVRASGASRQRRPGQVSGLPREASAIDAGAWDSGRSKRPEPWYADGLRFACVRGCTRCCRGFPGDVFVNDEEIAAIAAFLGLPDPEFRDAFLRPAGSGRLSLRDRGDYECVMLEAGGCSIYPVRPRQCRTFPFWPEIIASADAWERQAKTCPGINYGMLYTRKQIEALAGIY